MNEVKQIVLGIVSSLSLWIVGILMSGAFPAVADYIYFDGSPLIVIYPLIVAAVFVVAAYVCSRKGYEEMYTTFILSYLLSYVLLCFLGLGALLLMFLTPYLGEDNVLLNIGGLLYFPLIIFGAPALSVLTGLSNMIGSFFAYIIDILFVLIGTISSVIIFRKRMKKNKKN